MTGSQGMDYASTMALFFGSQVDEVSKISNEITYAEDEYRNPKDQQNKHYDGQPGLSDPRIGGRKRPRRKDE